MASILKLVASAVTSALLLGSGAALGSSPPRSGLPDIPNPKVVADAPEIGRYVGTLVVSGANPRTLNPVVAVESSSTDICRGGLHGGGDIRLPQSPDDRRGAGARSETG